MIPRTVVIAGAGLAGARAAETLRTEGFTGRVVMVGEEPTAPYERPALSKEFLAGTRDEESLLLRPQSYWDDRAIELVVGERVVEIRPAARSARTSSGRVLEFDAFLVATGARPRRLPLTFPRGVHELRTLADARALREELRPGRNLAVVGGGFVGAEVASTARSLGLGVTIVEAAPAPLSRVLGEVVGHLLADRWRAHGVDVRLATGLAGFRTRADGRVESLVLGDGSELRTDAVLVGVGVEPAGELLPNRPVPWLHAAGDVAGPGHWTAAALDGVSAARRMLGLPPQAPQPSFVWSDQFGLRLQVVGTPRPGDLPEVEGGSDSFLVRYRSPEGHTRAALLANRPAEAAAARRALTPDVLPLAA
jgi:3-phenylpropionate/trans-cinnamate dioxygenase ferredoxin reductase subunit